MSPPFFLDVRAANRATEDHPLYRPIDNITSFPKKQAFFKISPLILFAAREGRKDRQLRQGEGKARLRGEKESVLQGRRRSGRGEGGASGGR